MKVYIRVRQEAEQDVPGKWHVAEQEEAGYRTLCGKLFPRIAIATQNPPQAERVCPECLVEEVTSG